MTHVGRAHKDNIGSPIPQVDGLQAENGKASFTFNSDYAEEDILDSLCELFPDENNSVIKKTN